MNLAGIQRRIEKLEKSATEGVTLYLMASGEHIAFSDSQRKAAFADAVYGIDTPGARILLNAVGSDDGAQMISLLRAIVNPIDTEPQPNDATTVGGEPVAHNKPDTHYLLLDRVRRADAALVTAEYELVRTRQNKPLQSSLFISFNAEIDYEKRCELKQAAYQRAKQEQESAACEWDEYIKAGKQRNQ